MQIYRYRYRYLIATMHMEKQRDWTGAILACEIIQIQIIKEIKIVK